jgi:hypothetical protein
VTAASERDPWAVAVEKTFREARSAGMTIADAADVVVAVLREKIDAHAAEGVTDPDDVVHMQSILSARSGEPLVQIRCGPLQWQWETGTTRSHALKLLAVAEAAEHDAAVYRWMTLGPMDYPAAAAVRAIGELRRFRGDAEREDWREPGDRS